MKLLETADAITEPAAISGRRISLDSALPEARHCVSIPSHANFFRKLLAFTGPGYLISVGYMDPGNWATDLAGGSRFGYTLLSVILLSSLMAMVLQSLAVRLGIATGRDLAQACRDHFSRPLALFLWAMSEIAIVACDLAEVLGSAIALKLLFGMPIAVGVCLTAADVLLILLLQKKGFRRLEAVVIALVALIGVCFAAQLALVHPALHLIFQAMLLPTQLISNPQMLYMGVAIIGATVMPHNLYLHSSTVLTRPVGHDENQKREAIFFATLDSTLALTLAFLINASILILAAAAFHAHGHYDVADLTQAHQLLTPLLGSGFGSLLFAVALLASGQSATLTGTMAGQIVMEGFLDIRLPAWLRRLITRLVAIVPALFVTAFYGEKGANGLLVLSQVILSLQLPFAVVPLVLFTSDKTKMGALVNGRAITLLASSIAVLIMGLNSWMLISLLKAKM